MAQPQNLIPRNFLPAKISDNKVVRYLIFTAPFRIYAYLKSPFFIIKQVFVEDALGDRSWVDNENNKDFVSNISKVFDTVLPQKSSAASTKVGQDATTSVVQMETSSSTSTSVGIKGEEERIMADLGISLEAEETIHIRNR